MKAAAKWVRFLKGFIYGESRASVFRLSRRWIISACIAMLGGMLLAGDLAQAVTIEGGDILVVDTGTNKLFRVDPVTGVRSVISDFSNSAQGPVNSASPMQPSLSGVAVGQGQIFVTNLFAGIYSVNPTTGNRTLVSNFNQGAIQGSVGYGVVVDVLGRVVTNLNAQALVRVAPRIDTRVIVSNLLNAAQGSLASTCSDLSSCYINDLALDPLGMILVGVNDGFTHSAIYRVDPVTGYRSLLSNFNNPAQGTDVVYMDNPGLTVENLLGQILVNSGGYFAAPRNLLLRINPITGNRTVLSDFDNPAQGLTGSNLSGLGVETLGTIIVGAGIPGVGGATQIFRVNPLTGRRVLLSDSTNPQQGPAFGALTYLAVVPINAGFFAPPPANLLGSPFGPTN
jgi:sugar lactone lactonase YvrE